MARLIKRQVEQLKQARELLEQKRREYVESCNHLDSLADIGLEGVTDLNSLYDMDQIAIINSRIKRIDTLLKNYELVEEKEIATSSVGIGTFFEATIIDDEEPWTATFQLVEELSYTNQSTEFIPVSLQSPFGKNILDKKEKDTFTYNHKGSKISGTIDKIYGLSLETEKVKTL